MRIDTDDIKQVLALFDKEDIPYINFEYLIKKNILKPCTKIISIMNLHLLENS